MCRHPRKLGVPSAPDGRTGTAGQLVGSLWWLVVLDDVLPSTVGNGALVVPLLYGALAAVAAGLTFARETRAWTARPGG